MEHGVRYQAIGAEFVTPPPKVFVSGDDTTGWQASVVYYTQRGRAGTLLGTSAGALTEHMNAPTEQGVLGAAVAWLRDRYGAGLELVPWE